MAVTAHTQDACFYLNFLYKLKIPTLKNLTILFQMSSLNYYIQISHTRLAKNLFQHYRQVCFYPTPCQRMTIFRPSVTSHFWKYLYENEPYYDLIKSINE